MRSALALALLYCLSCAGSADRPTATPEQQVERLMKQGLGVARGRLERGLSLWPYAYAELASGRIVRIGSPGTQTEADSLAGVEATGPIEPDAALDQLTAHLASQQAQQKRYRAVAIFSEVEVRLPKRGETSAIQVGLEQISGYCKAVYYPYGKLVQGELVLGEPVTEEHRGAVFEKCK